MKRSKFVFLSRTYYVCFITLNVNECTSHLGGVGWYLLSTLTVQVSTVLSPHLKVT